MTDKAPVTVEQGDDLSERLLWCANADDASAFMTRKAALTRHDLRQASARLQSIAALEEEIKRLREALEPFALNIRPEVPDDFAIETVAWTAAQHRAARTALEGGGS